MEAKELCKNYLCRLRAFGAFLPQLLVMQVATRLAIAAELHPKSLQSAQIIFAQFLIFQDDAKRAGDAPFTAA